MQKSNFNLGDVVAVDLFCGAGGLTHGLVRAGIRVAAGVDVDPACRYPFESNNHARFVLGDIGSVSVCDVKSSYPKGAKKVLVGCAPCQPFSRYSRASDRKDEDRWGLLSHFSRIVDGVRPDIVSMENVPELTHHEVFCNFVARLEKLGYLVGFHNVACPDYGIPQYRTRLVLFASLLGLVALRPATHKPNRYRTVKDAISKLVPLESGQCDPKDPMHRSSRLSSLNLERIKTSRPGGCWRDWPKHLVAKCHQVESGKTYPSVYGRMEWDKPAPTITTQFFGFGNGRFGHPEQDRAISLREGSVLQSFPMKYRFVRPGESVSFSALGRLIGNAVPVRLGEVIGNSILEHIVKSNG